MLKKIALLGFVALVQGCGSAPSKADLALQGASYILTSDWCLSDFLWPGKCHPNFEYRVKPETLPAGTCIVLGAPTVGYPDMSRSVRYTVALHGREASVSDAFLPRGLSSAAEEKIIRKVCTPQ